MHEIQTGTGSRSGKIHMDPDELATIIKYLEAIFKELETNAVPNIQKLKNIEFYTAGKAKNAMQVYPQANEKVLDLKDHYIRSSSLVFDILDKMIKTDKDLAEQVIAKLRV